MGNGLLIKIQHVSQAQTSLPYIMHGNFARAKKATHNTGRYRIDIRQRDMAEIYVLRDMADGHSGYRP